MKITDIQLFKCSESWDEIQKHSANVAIDDKFMIQLGSDDVWSIPHSDIAAWDDDSDQDNASQKYDAQGLADSLGALEMIEKLIADESFDN